ncbi:MAG TPA: rhomboid family intramembrane serine protease [bacterium]|nr:rhomboid family intramembrane serine protease [bacterium]
MIFPLRDDIPSRTFPIAMYLVMGACAAAFYYTLALPSLVEVKRLFTTFGVIPAQVTGVAVPTPAAFPVRLGASLFLHGGWTHLLGNMLFLWIFADNVEDAMGHGPFLVFYLLCGVIANIVHVLANPLSTEPAIGASGAIAGVLGAYLLLYPGARVQVLVWLLFVFVRFVWVPAVLFLPVWVFLQLSSGLATLGVPSAGGVAWWAHVGGFASGMALVRIFAAGRKR